MSDIDPANREKTGRPGPGKPPVEHQWKPGESGNPTGRPKKKPFTELYEELANDPQFMKKAKAAIVSMVQSGRMVSQLQIKEMADRVEGRVTQSVEVNGELTLTLSERMSKARERVKT